MSKIKELKNVAKTKASKAKDFVKENALELTLIAGTVAGAGLFYFGLSKQLSKAISKIEEFDPNEISFDKEDGDLLIMQKDSMWTIDPNKLKDMIDDKENSTEE